MSFALPVSFDVYTVHQIFDSVNTHCAQFIIFYKIFTKLKTKYCNTANYSPYYVSNNQVSMTSHHRQNQVT